MAGDQILTYRDLMEFLPRLSDAKLDERIISQGEDGQIEPSTLMDVWMDEIDDFRLCIVPTVNIVKD